MTVSDTYDSTELRSLSTSTRDRMSRSCRALEPCCIHRNTSVAPTMSSRRTYRPVSTSCGSQVLTDRALQRSPSSSCDNDGLHIDVAHRALLCAGLTGERRTTGLLDDHAHRACPGFAYESTDINAGCEIIDIECGGVHAGCRDSLVHRRDPRTAHVVQCQSCESG